MCDELSITIDGSFMGKQVNGIPRYARELIKAMDRNLPQWNSKLIIPGGAKVREPLSLQNTTQLTMGRRSGQFWEQLELPRINRLLDSDVELYLCSSMPIKSNHSVLVVHDVAPIVHPEFYSRINAKYNNLLLNAIIPQATAIVTVSEFSKQEILRLFPEVETKLDVVPCAWQHVLDIEEDRSILRDRNLEEASFYFSISSITPNKNLKWIAETARRNPREQFVVAGGIDKNVFREYQIPEVSNVKYLGYITDGEAKALFSTCKAFLFPTFYEGFGIPPLEALACGAKIIVSDSPVMREIYGKSASYIDPYEPCHNLNDLLKDHREEAHATLDRFSWETSALKMIDVIKSVGGR